MKSDVEMQSVDDPISYCQYFVPAPFVTAVIYHYLSYLGFAMIQLSFWEVGNGGALGTPSDPVSHDHPLDQGPQHQVGSYLVDCPDDAKVSPCFRWYG